MKVTIECTPEEIAELLQAIWSSKEQRETKDSSSIADSEIIQVKV